jgi:hypothetical protein
LIISSQVQWFGLCRPKKTLFDSTKFQNHEGNLEMRNEDKRSISIMVLRLFIWVSS